MRTEPPRRQLVIEADGTFYIDRGEDRPELRTSERCSYCNSDEHVRKDCHHLRVYQK